MSYVMRVNPINVNNQWVNSEKFYFNSPVRVEIINFLDGLYSELDWIGLFKKDDIFEGSTNVPDDVISIYWTYPKNFANNTFTINDLTSGVWSNVAENGEVKRPDWEQYKNGLPEGDYSICLMYNDGRKILARVDFTISNSAINYSGTNDNGLTSNKSVYVVGEPIVVTVNMDYTLDWIGLYQGTYAYPSTSYESLLWTYIDSNGTKPCNMSIITNDRENGVMVYSRDLVKEMQYTYYEPWGTYLSKGVLKIDNYRLFLCVNDSYIALDEIPIKIETGFIWALEWLTADDEVVYPYGTEPPLIHAQGENFVHQWGGVGSGAPAIVAKNYLKLSGWIVNAFNKEGLPESIETTECYYYRINGGEWTRAYALNYPRPELNDAGILYADTDGFYASYPYYYYYNYESAMFADLTIPTKNLFDVPNVIEVAVKNYKDELIPFIVFADVHGKAYEVTYDTGTMSNEVIEPRDGVTVLSAEDLPNIYADNAEFLGWYYSDNMDRKAEPGQSLTQDVLLRAKWKIAVFDKFITRSELTGSDYDNDNELSLSYIKNRPFYEYYDERATLLKQTVFSDIEEDVYNNDTLYKMNRINLSMKAWTKVDVTDDFGETFEGHYAFCGGKYVLYIDDEVYTTYVPDNELAVSIRFQTEDNLLRAMLYADFMDYDSDVILYLNDVPNKTHSIRIDRFNATGFSTGLSTFDFDRTTAPTDENLDAYFSGANDFVLGSIYIPDLFVASDFMLCDEGLVTLEQGAGGSVSHQFRVKKVIAPRVNIYYDTDNATMCYVYKSLHSGKEYTVGYELKLNEDNKFTVKLINTPLEYTKHYLSIGKSGGYYEYYAKFGISCPGVDIESIPDTKLIKYIDDKFINPDLLKSLNTGPIITTTEELYKMNHGDYSKVISITGKGENASYYDSFYIYGTLTSCISIGYGSFEECDVSSLTIPVCNHIGEDAFSGSDFGYNRDFICPSLTSAGRYAFAYTSGLKSLTVPVLYEMPVSFLEYSGVASVNAPTLTKVGNDAFYGCSGLKTLNAPNITYVGSEAFFNCSLEITKDFIEKLEHIGYRAFYNCKDDGATKYVFKDGVVLQQEIFYGFNSNLEEIELPENFTTGYGTFKYCSNLKKVVCRGDFNSNSTFSYGTPIRYFECYGVASMNSDCFSSFSSNDTDMTIILRDETTMSTIDAYTFRQYYSDISTNAQIKVYVPESLKSAYESDYYWGLYLNRTNTLGEPLMVINTIEGSEYEIK